MRENKNVLPAHRSSTLRKYVLWEGNHAQCETAFLNAGTYATSDTLDLQYVISMNDSKST